MGLNRKFAAAPEIATSSMADIAFLLIVFFMVTAVFASTKGLVTQGADPETRDPLTAEPAVFIKILDEDSILLDGQSARPDQILSYLEPKLLNWPEKPILLHTVADAPYSAMVRVFDEVMKVNIDRSKGGLGISTPVNIQVPSHRELRAYEEIFQVAF